MSKTLNVLDFGPNVGSGRSSGIRVREAVAGALDGGAGRVVLNFEGVAFLTPGFADELVGVLAYHLGEDWLARHLHLKDLDAADAAEVQRVIAHRLRKRTERNDDLGRRCSESRIDERVRRCNGTRISAIAA